MSFKLPDPVGCRSEIDRATSVLMHDPKDELFFGVLHPAAALFEGYLDFRKANNEHKHYQELLRESGLKVFTVREVLLSGTIDTENDNAVIDSEETRQLREFAKTFLTFKSVDERVSQEEQQAYRDKIISEAHPFDLLSIILKSPVIELRSTVNNTGVAANYMLHPALNLFFTRDQAITTSRGVVLGKMHSPQREKETRILEFCYRKLGVPPIHTISADGAFLEGGDFIPYGDVAFVGCGMRTTIQAIEELFAADAFGTDTVVVVKDKRFWQQQMHLDTYFNIIDKDLAIFSVERTTSDAAENTFLAADFYTRDAATKKYTKTRSDVPFVEYVKKELGMEIIPISLRDSDTYACNFITVGPRRIVAVAGQSQELQDAFAAHHVDVKWAPLRNCTLGYGAAHCMTQILSRKK